MDESSKPVLELTFSIFLKDKPVYSFDFQFNPSIFNEELFMCLLLALLEK